MNCQLREELGFTLNQVANQIKCSDIVIGDVHAPSAGVGLASLIYKMRSADGNVRRYVSYWRDMFLDGKFYGTIGSTVRADRCVDCIKPAPLRKIPGSTPRFSFTSAGVMAGVVPTYMDKFGPLLNTSDPSKIMDLNSFREEVRELHQLGIIKDPVSPTADFFPSLRAYPDFNFQLVDEKSSTGDIHALCFTKGWRFAGDRAYSVPHNEIAMWLSKQGMAFAEIDASDHTVPQKICRNRSDVHLEDDPEEWIQALFLGVPCFLMDRPWNTYLKTPWKVYSVESMFGACGIEPDTTLCHYDPTVYSDIRIHEVV